MPPVRLFIGNLPYQATEDDLRAHFATVGEPTQIVRPLDRETGRARGFAFVEYADRETAEAAIRQFDGQLFMGRPLAVSEARAREDRGPGGPRPGGAGGGYGPRAAGPGGGYGSRPSGPGGPRSGGGFGGPRAGGGGFGGPRSSGGGFGGPRSGGGFGGPRSGPGESIGGRGGRDFGPPAPPRGKGPKKAYQQKERTPKGPIPTKFTGRMYDLDDIEKDDDVQDELPEFMKPEASDKSEPEPEASESGEPEASERNKNEPDKGEE